MDADEPETETPLALLTKYGARELAIGTLALGTGVAVSAWAAARFSPWLWALAACDLAVWAWVLAFFRDPERLAPPGDGLFVSPADGRVSDITPLGADSLLGCPGIQIGVFMNVFNVHVNRAPCDGEVVSVTHRDGAFLDVRDPHASERNESTAIHLRHSHGGQAYPVVVRQIAGLVARRIVTDLAAGQTLRRGQRIGMIKFGSRLELLLPESLAAEIRVSVGQKVRAGQTVLAEAGRNL